MALHLYYDNKKGLVKSNDHAIGCSIVEHDGKGYCCPLHEQILEIPERSITITVRTNLHYGSKSYMNASITMMKKPVLNFIDNSLFHSIKTIHAKPEDWNSLFDNIILVHNNIFNSDKFINSYFDAVDVAIKGTDIRVGNELHHAILRLSEITNVLKDSIYGDSIIIDQRIKNACHLLIKRMMKLKFASLNTTFWEKELRSIFNYLGEREELLEVLAGE